jgi:membrane associated rhomboid family serine protease
LTLQSYRSDKLKRSLALKSKSGKLNKTNLIIITCILASVFFWFAALSGASIEYWAYSTENLLAGRVWTLITGLFIHGDILHLFGNMIFLYVFGNTLEKELGAGKTLLAFFVGGVLTFLLGVFFYAPSALMIGASAAIFTLIAIVMLVKPLKFSFIFFMPVGLIAIIYFVYNVLAVQLGVESNVAYISHLIGFGIGIPLGAVWSKNVIKNLLITIGLFILYLIIVLLIVPFILAMLEIPSAFFGFLPIIQVGFGLALFHTI